MPDRELARALRIRPVGRGDWKLVAQLFGDNGACGGCWCMWWRVERGGKTWEAAKGATNRQRLQRLLASDRVHAVLALDGEEPVGWCSFGPRASFPRLLNSRVLQRPLAAADEPLWSIVCFFIAARRRGRGVATRLLAAAAARAFALGARTLEGYPVETRDGKPSPAAFAWTGVPPLFARAGFRRIARSAGMRPIYVLARKQAARKRTPASRPAVS